MSAAVCSSAVPSPVERAGFRLGAHGLMLDVSDPVAAAILERAYGAMRTDTTRGFRQSATIRRLADGRLHARYGRHVISASSGDSGAPERTAYNAAREIFARFAATVPGSMAFYGAAVGIRGAGVLIVGPSAIGKTLLALHLAHQGATFLGDETALVTLRGAELSALPRRPSLRESALRLLPTDAMRSSVASGEHAFTNESGRFWYALDERALQGIAPSGRALPLRAVCIVRDRREEYSSRRLELAGALPLIAQRAYARPSELNQLAALRKALRDAVCLEITLGKPDASASAILREVSACV